MGEEQNDILNAIQNGFFNEGIYRIAERTNKVAGQLIIPGPENKEVLEKITPPVQIISVAEEPANKLKLLQKDEEHINLPKEEAKVEFFGGNKKGIAIIVSYPDERWIYFKDKIILERILASIKLTFEDVALINTHFFKPESIDELSDTLNISKLIGFGINDPFLMGLKREEPVKTAKIAVFLMNSDLDDIAMNKDKKRILWNNIKLMFDIR